jgi:hypothetical protein
MQERYNFKCICAYYQRETTQNAQKEAFVEHTQIVQMYEEDTIHAPAFTD